jgi:23S rRNA pseudouridine1911/1915/1917 synthase
MIEILYEDNHIIALNKKPSDLSQGDRTGDPALDEEIKRYIAEKYGKPGAVFLGVVHRLDRPVGGVILYARTSKALARLNEMFRTKDVKKTYYAIVKERPPEEEGTLSQFLKKNEKQNKTYVYDKPVNGSKEASMSYKILGHSEKYYLLEVQIESGRHHQIRAQLAAMGCPIKGDLKYGFPRSNEDGSISLLARKIEFVHPVSKVPVSIKAPLPATDIWQHFRNSVDD